MSYLFTETSPEQITGLMPIISMGLDETYKRWHDSVDWTPRDIYNSIKQDKAQLNFIYEGKTRIGFIITRYFYTEFERTKYMHVWLMYLYPEYRRKIWRVLPEMSEFLVRKSKHDGARFIEMDTPRKGWDRLLNGKHMKRQRTVYRKEI